MDASDEFKKLLKPFIAMFEKTIASETIKQKDVEHRSLYYKVINGLAEDLSCENAVELEAVLDKIKEVNIGAYLSIILKKAAHILDLQYPDHIKNSEEFYAISLLDGKIKKVPASKVKSYKTLALFRTLGDARSACRLVKNTLREVYGGKQKNKKRYPYSL